MCSRTAASRDRRSAMMFHYIDYADMAVRTGNRQRRENWGGKRVDKQMETETGEAQTHREKA